MNKVRKADRIAMANAVHKLADEFGFTVVMDEEVDRCITVTVQTKRGLSVSMDFDGKSRYDGLLAHWFIRGGENVGVLLSDQFEYVGDRNQYHFQKATTFSKYFDPFIDILRNGFAMVKNGTAFQK